MKVALMTFHDTTNFGSFLQTYGLYKALQDIGLQCDVLDYKCKAIMERELPKKKPDNLSLKKIIAYFLFEPKKRAKFRCFQEALHKYMTFTQPYNKYDVQSVNGKYDAFVIGSDILWDLDITGGDLAYFLDFVDDKTDKFSFSTSIGKPWTETETKEIAPLLKRFNKISLREKESKKWVENIIGSTVESVCDPTMLMDFAFWSKVAEKAHYAKKPLKKPYILLYFGDPSGQMMSEAREYSSLHGAEICVINYGKAKANVKNISPYMVEDFIWLVKNAEAIFTSSYHGFLFSLYFEKPIYYYNGNSKEHSIRFESVISRLGIEACRRTGQEKYSDVVIDYSLVTPKINEWRKESIEILTSYWREC